MQIHKKTKLKEEFLNSDTYISLIIVYLIIGFIIKWYNNCEEIFIPLLFWPYLLVDYFLKRLESDVPAKYCY